jgi:hypothetical protein
VIDGPFQLRLAESNRRQRLPCTRVRYFASVQPESRGDKHEAWGASRWFFETSDDGVVTRQVEVYDHGPTLRYDQGHSEDEDGLLSEKPLDFDDFPAFKIDPGTFDAAWSAAR